MNGYIIPQSNKLVYVGHVIETLGIVIKNVKISSHKLHIYMCNITNIANVFLLIHSKVSSNFFDDVLINHYLHIDSLNHCDCGFWI